MRLIDAILPNARAFNGAFYFCFLKKWRKVKEKKGMKGLFVGGLDVWRGFEICFYQGKEPPPRQNLFFPFFGNWMDF